MSKITMANTSLRPLAKVELGSLVSQVKITTMPEDLPDTTRFIGLEDIASQNGQIIGVSKVSSVRSRVFQFQSGDVLYGRLRPYLKKVAVADFNGAASGEIIVLRCSDLILPRYLQILLLSEDFTFYINSRVKGDRPRTNMTILASYQLELPSIPVQEAICAHYSQLEIAVSKLEHAVKKIDSQSRILVDAIRTKLLWEQPADLHTPLGKIVESIDYGTSQKSASNYTGTPVLRIPNISSNGKIDDSNLKYAPLESKDIDKYLLKEGDLLLIRSNGSLSLVGRSAKVDKAYEGYAFAGYLLRLHPINGILSDYLLEVFRSRNFMQQVETAARSTSGVNNLSAGRLADFLIPLKSAESQKKIVDILTRVQSAVIISIDNLNKTLSKAKTILEMMRGNWLGHSLRDLPENMNSAMDSKDTKLVDHEKSNILEKEMDIDTIILQRLNAFPSRTASFETLSQGLKYDYDEIRDAIFRMLSMNPPKLVQRFDKEKHSIILRCPE
ncbi:restriction endonuclease subunit S [Raoultella ornithinolytica]|uniref:restriction endonuclease subunit S n=1 Tax=Raoultella ornithinolytica TaxID=54291 RepID=UPI0009BF7818|nr:restriction endonuclease subunit S [Raoultella ornithinolytica]MDV1095905.1 restriction endonuclease subunit S [Raoultella ornithinolytica]MDV1123754.1 restriction endonuclease subunit S [Raoultella ornithinolytica]MDV1894054.1 restriction endonuclease subunit S [Raoultella ornithinolytica]